MTSPGGAAAGAGELPGFSAFAQLLAPNDPRGRALRKLHGHLCALDPSAALERRNETLEQLARWVCAGPKPFAVEGGEPADPPATLRLRALVAALELWPALRVHFSRVMGSVLAESSPLRLLCEIGLPNERGLWDETADRLARRLLPPAPDEADLAELVARLFRTERDAKWLASLPPELVGRFLVSLGDVWRPVRESALDASMILATRVSALGMSEDIRRRALRTDPRSSPFFRLARAEPHALAEIGEACRQDLVAVHENLERHGVSVDVVYRLDVIAKCLERIDAIMAVSEPADPGRCFAAELAFAAELCAARVRERSVRDVVRTNTKLLARKIIERAGETGEHYITATRGEWWKMLASAGGGGFLTAFTSAGKFVTHWAKLAPALDGLVNSANYATSFVGMQLLGFTLATKQPSMTAAALAGSIREQKDEHQLDDLVTTIARICRSQLAAALGNVGVVIPSAILLDLVYSHFAGHAFLDQETARHTIDSLHPWRTGTPLFAALTGVLLWASSLGAGWLENWAVYRRLPEAISRHWIRRWVGSGVTGWLSRRFRHHIAGFGGNVTLGVLLGMLPAFAVFFGIPLEVRHVTLSTGSLVLSIESIGSAALLRSETLWACFSIVCIGALNFGVSFVLALGVAFRAREVPLRRGSALGIAVLARFLRRPLEFVYPPKSDTGEEFLHRPSLAPRSVARHSAPTAASSTRPSLGVSSES